MNAMSRAFARSLLLVAVLTSGLVVPADADARKKKTPDYTELMLVAEAEVAAGRIEPALVGFNEAAKADPTRKEAWVRSAQLQFDAGNYGRAIVAAEEVLKRDPADLIADSVLTVGGLRVAAISLQRLRDNGALATSDSARKEAEQLAATMRATLGKDILIPDEQKRATAASASRRKSSQRASNKRSAAGRRAASAATEQAAAPETAPPAKPSSSKPAGVNPFGVLGGK